MPKKKEEPAVEEPKVEEEVKAEEEIEVSDPMDLRPKELPLVVKLPKNASKAQEVFAKTLNGYAYKNPKKWADKKDDKIVNGKLVKGLITKLKELKDAPDPVESKLKINNSGL